MEMYVSNHAHQVLQFIKSPWGRKQITGQLYLAKATDYSKYVTETTLIEKIIADYKMRGYKPTGKLVYNDTIKKKLIGSIDGHGHLELLNETVGALTIINSLDKIRYGITQDDLVALDENNEKVSWEDIEFSVKQVSVTDFDYRAWFLERVTPFLENEIGHSVTIKTWAGGSKVVSTCESFLLHRDDPEYLAEMAERLKNAYHVNP